MIGSEDHLSVFLAKHITVQTNLWWLCSNRELENWQILFHVEERSKHTLSRVLIEVEQLIFAFLYRTTSLNISFVLTAAESFKASDNLLIEGKWIRLSQTMPIHVSPIQVEQLVFALWYKNTSSNISFVLMAAETFKALYNLLVEGKWIRLS